MPLLLSCRPGLPFPLGARCGGDGVNFAVYAPDDPSLRLVLENPQKHRFWLPLTDCHKGVRHLFVPGVDRHWRYCYQSGRGSRPRYLLDPYATQLSELPFFAHPYDAGFDWQGVGSPRHDWHETVIAEVHVKGFTHRHPAVPIEQRGRYAGLCHPGVIRQLKETGITAVQLMPVAEWRDEPELPPLGLTNYWGYNPLAPFSPSRRYARQDPVNEFKTLVRELHRAGIEVILDLVLGHTAEGGEEGPVWHWKHLCPDYYLRDQDGLLANYSGCGNTVDLRHPAALRQVMDCLRFWAEEFRVDGFRIGMATTLGREGEHFAESSPFFRALAQDPVLQRCKLIAEPRDRGPHGDQSGRFPDDFAEGNDRFRDGITGFWRGDKVAPAELAHCLTGSRGRFSEQRWPALLPVNYICSHDGPTLVDLVGGPGRGGQGQAAGDDVVAFRRQCNLLACLLLSFGVPHLLGSDLAAHSQRGNVNAYDQDNVVGWLDWGADPEGRLRTVISRLAALRRQWIIPLQQRMSYASPQTSYPDMHWLRPDGEAMEEVERREPGLRSLQLLISEPSLGSVLWQLNRGDRAEYHRLPGRTPWRLALDSARPGIELSDEGGSHLVAAHSLRFWVQPPVAGDGLAGPDGAAMARLTRWGE
ncbi:glycogen debranching enzyme [Zobellella denitrificans]|uniref:Glycosyl hydrolase family 13 catalytic domain-containing protein n=1 Tax=Zobellella iuensis TaxID=2803811 RepID=A0ABS1QW57_9GAMM|nr:MULTISPECIES: hypothetical protein [Zobellella]MBL1379110.1 hypothetical protein [Zobellella iuensis]OXS14805.1 glycogen debranching enzyme [Zobellella denitrificans]